MTRAAPSAPASSARATPAATPAWVARMMIIQTAATAAVMFALLAMLGGCAATDPLLNEDLWEPSGTNEMNIAAQVANPQDLLHGREPVGGADGEQAAAAVLRLRTGHVKALPDSAITDLHVQQAPSSAGAP